MPARACGVTSSTGAVRLLVGDVELRRLPLRRPPLHASRDGLDDVGLRAGPPGPVRLVGHGTSSVVLRQVLVEQALDEREGDRRGRLGELAGVRLGDAEYLAGRVG